MQADPRLWLSASTVEIKIEYSREEFLRAYRRRLLHSSSMWIVFVNGAVFAVLGAVILTSSAAGQSSNNALFGTCFLALGLLLIAMFARTAYRVPRRLWERVGSRGPMSMVFSNDGVLSRSGTGDERKLQWSAFKSVGEMKEDYKMRLASSGGYIYVPKVAFASKTDEEMFRQLVERHTKAHLHGS